MLIPKTILVEWGLEASNVVSERMDKKGLDTVSLNFASNESI